MAYYRWPDHFDVFDVFDSLFPDFLLAFLFFTALIYAALGRRFDQPRAMAVASASVGLALAAGLVWWEYQVGYSVRDLGPIAVGLVVLLLGAIVFQAVRQVGGSLAGAGIGLGLALLVAWTLELPSEQQQALIQTATLVASIVGVFSLMHHRRGGLARVSLSEPLDLRHDARDLYESHRVNRKLARGFRDLRDRLSHDNPQDSRFTDDLQSIQTQINRMLPAEGHLTERLAQLREKAVLMRQGHIARIKELQHKFKGLDPTARRRASEEMVLRYRQLKLDTRLERLDKAVAAAELRIRGLIKQIPAYIRDHDRPALLRCIEMAGKLQQHNERLFRAIERTESKLIRMAEQAAWAARGVNHD
jgi:hypothetical protein